jgi:hypothetical protein
MARHFDVENFSINMLNDKEHVKGLEQDRAETEKIPMSDAWRFRNSWLGLGFGARAYTFRPRLALKKDAPIPRDV